MDLALTGKTAVVTGASRGIGLAVAESLAAAGVRVVGAARTITPELEKVSAATVSADLSTREGAFGVIETALAEVGGIDILVNNVGGGDPEWLDLDGFLAGTDEQWRHYLDVNLFSAIWATRAALPSLLERRGSIINVSSINAHVPGSGPVGYSEAKAALAAFGKRLSEEFGPQGVRVNTVSPGPVATRIWRDEHRIGAKLAAAQGITQDQFLDALPTSFDIASRRITEPDEVAALITFIASGLAGNIVGADLVIDGGIIKTT
ncbi:SDR family oxidoreductase [Nocardia asteroides]|uniref:SDR family oxidoreductase n=1 Tax=Nocardia asteroides TaxID=1824 RepID=UPI0034047BAD